MIITFYHRRWWTFLTNENKEILHHFINIHINLQYKWFIWFCAFCLIIFGSNFLSLNSLPGKNLLDLYFRETKLKICLIFARNIVNFGYKHLRIYFSNKKKMTTCKKYRRVHMIFMMQCLSHFWQMVSELCDNISRMYIPIRLFI